MQDYPLLQQVSVENPEAFWTSVLQHLGIQFHKMPQRLLTITPQEIHVINEMDISGNATAQDIILAHCPGS